MLQQLLNLISIVALMHGLFIVSGMFVYYTRQMPTEETESFMMKSFLELCKAKHSVAILFGMLGWCFLMANIAHVAHLGFACFIFILLVLLYGTILILRRKVK